jgi:hypothetical protein
MLIKKFNDFLLEKLSYAEDAEIISKYIINHLDRKDNWDDKEIIKVDSDIINEVIIEFIEEMSVRMGSEASFIPHKSNFDSKTIYLRFDPERVTKESIHHEIFHAYDWIKNKGNHLTGELEMAIISSNQYYNSVENVEVSEIIYAFYITSDAEIRAYYNQDIYAIKSYINYIDENPTQDKRKELLEETETYQNYNLIKDLDINDSINKLSNLELNEFISVVETIKNMQQGEERDLIIKDYSEEEKKIFIKSLNKVFDKQKGKIIKYLGKIKSYLSNNIYT